MTGAALEHLRALFDSGRMVDRADAELLERFGRLGDGPAFAALVDRHGPMVLGVCRRMLADPHDVDDAFQAVFLVLARRAGTLRVRGGALGGWLHGVAVRVARRARSDRARRLVREAPDAESLGRAPAPDPDPGGLRAWLDEELERLPEAYRAPLVLCHLEGLTHDEAAARLGWPVGTVRTRLFRGRARLRARMSAGAGLASDGPARAEVPPALRQWAASAGPKLASGESPGRVAPAPAVALAGRILMAMHAAKWKTFGLAALAAGLFGVGLGAGLAAPGAPPAPAAQPEARPTPPTPPAVATAGSVEGIVRDEAGAPVAGAAVLASVRGEDDPDHPEVNPISARREATTGPDGRFRVEIPGEVEPGERVWINLIAHKDGLAPAARELRAGRPPDGPPELVLGPAREYQGTVVDAEGRPIEGAEARLFQFVGPAAKAGGLWDRVHPPTVLGTPLERLFVARTDAEGHFRFPAVPPPGQAAVEVSAPGMATVQDRMHFPDDRAATMEMLGFRPRLIRLVPAARVAGRVVSTVPGVSPAGRKVVLRESIASVRERGGRPPRPVGEAVTDAEGRFEMGGFPASKADLWVADLPADGPWTAPTFAGLALVPGEAVEARIELVEGVAVEGTVRDADTGGPVAGAKVYASDGPDRRSAVRAETDADGRFRLRLPPGDAILTLVAPRGYVVPKAEASRTLHLEPGPGPVVLPPFDMRREARGARIHGTVRDAAGRPVAGASVIVGYAARGAGGWGLPPLEPAVAARQAEATGPDGRFTLRVPPDAGAAPPGGQLWANVAASKDGLAPAGRVVLVDPVPTAEAVDLVLGPGQPYEGRVVDSRGRPVAGAEARLLGFVGPHPDFGRVRNLFLEGTDRGTGLEGLLAARTDADGRFRFPAVSPMGEEAVEVVAPGLATHRDPPRRPWDLDEDAAAADRRGPNRFVLAPEARLEGRVVTDLPGVSTAGLRVRVRTTLAPIVGLRGRPGRDDSAVTDAEGRFSIGGLPAGEADVLIDGPPADAPWTYRTIRGLPLSPGETAGARIELIEGVLVEGSARDAESGQPVAGVAVVPALERDALGPYHATVDDRGRFRLRLPPGEWALMVLPGGSGFHQAAEQAFQLTPGSGTVTLPPFEMRRSSRRSN